jgi:hydrogenase/urease accessory protein HupE
MIVVAALCGATTAAAHEVGLSRSEWAVGSTVTVEFTFARPDVLTLLPSADVDNDGVISEGEMNATVAAPVWQTITVTRGDVVCAVRPGDAAVVEGDGVALAGVFDCGDGSGAVDAALGFLEKLGSTHRHLAHVENAEGASERVAYRDNHIVTLSSAAPALPVFSYLGLGVEHILTGYDHLLFVCGLIVVLAVAGRVRSVIAIITAFTVAHSITLALAAMGAATLSASVVEPIIALSIVFVGVDSWRRPDPSGRWLLSFPFGLIHGFGFAGVLGEIGLPTDAALPALALFNVGVEVGQLAVVALFAPLLWWARLRWSEAARRRLVHVVSGGIAVIGAYWFVERVFFGD